MLQSRAKAECVPDYAVFMAFRLYASAARTGVGDEAGGEVDGVGTWGRVRKVGVGDEGELSRVL